MARRRPSHGLRSAVQGPLRRPTPAAEPGPDPDCGDDGERCEAFVVRMSLDDSGRPLRTRVAHARTGAEHVAEGWAPDDVRRFVEDCAGLWSPADLPGTAPATDPGAREHVIDVDVGRMLGGGPRDVDLRLAVAPTDPHDPHVHAELSVRPYPHDEQPWTVVRRRDADVDRTGLVTLRFEDLSLPRGVHRLRLRLTVHSSDAPEVTLK